MEIPKPQTWQPLDHLKLTVDIVIPCHNEAETLAQNVSALAEYLTALPYRSTITIVDNASTDATPDIAARLAQTLPHVRAVAEPRQGRGQALQTAWGQSTAEILVYMDEDLSTDLGHLPELLEPIVRGTAVLTVGTRLHKSSRIERGLKREIISRSYRWLVRTCLGLQASDAQCGFKAIRREAAQTLLPEIADTQWFFDTELIMRCQDKRWPIAEIPVRWTEDKDSRVRILRTAADDIHGIDRLRQETGKRITLDTLLLGGLMLGAAGLYLFNITINDYANSYYSAAVQAATVSWKAFFFGSLDAASYITVDKPPASIWAMALSTRLFGFSSFAMLLPQALLGAGTVGLVYAAVRRVFGQKEAVIAGLLMLASPVIALMFRFNNPDALLTFLLTASAYTFIRALENGRRAIWWLSLTGLITGLAFDAKMLQGLVLLPVLALVYLLAAPPKLVKRLWYLAAAGCATAVSVLWWPVAVWLTPATSRPYIGSSTNNNIWDLIFGYNGLGRLLGKMSFGGGKGPGGEAPFGQMAGALPGGGMPGGRMPGSGTGFGGSTGLWRMFNADFGPNIGWWLIVALTSAGLVIWLTRRLARSDRRRASALLWGGWIVLHAVVFSVTSGIIHPYYVVVMAPAIAALVGIGAPLLWGTYQRRLTSGWLLPLTIATTSLASFTILGYGSGWALWLRWVVLITGFTSSLWLAAAFAVKDTLGTKLAGGLAVIALVVGPISYTAATLGAKHTGSIPTSGPKASAMGMTNNDSSAADPALVRYLTDHRDGATWIIAVGSANDAAPIQISSGQPVMAIGGFSGSDAAMTLDRFKALVAAGKLKYYGIGQGPGGLGGMRGFEGMSGFSGPSGANNDITNWVKAHSATIDYGGNGSVTLYQLQ